MRKRKILDDEPIALTEKEKTQCQKNALAWRRIHCELFAAMETPFWDIVPLEQ